MADAEKDTVNAILNAYKDTPFVQRILYPDKYPKLDLGGGQHATHKMAYAQVGDAHIVFPTVLFDGKSLKDYGKDAIPHVLKTNNFIPFSTEAEAKWFSDRYKLAWEK